MSIVIRQEAVVVQLLSHVQLFETTWTAACQASLSSTISWSLLKSMSIELVMLSNHVILLLLLPSIFPIIKVFRQEAMVMKIKWSGKQYHIWWLNLFADHLK